MHVNSNPFLVCLVCVFARRFPTTTTRSNRTERRTENENGRFFSPTFYPFIRLFVYSFIFFYLGCHKIAGAFFNGDLVGERIRHPFPVPFQAPFVVVVPVEEVHLAVGLLHGFVQKQHLQQSPSTAFPHTDDDRLQRTHEFATLIIYVGPFVGRFL